MVVLLEAINYGWIHEEVNAGMLKLVNECTDEDVVYVGERSQIETIEKLYHGGKVCFEAFPKLLEGKEKESYKSTGYYFSLIRHCIKKYSAKRIFIMHTNTPCFVAILMAAFLNPSVSFRVCIHGTVERNLKRAKAHEMLFKICGWLKNVKIITFSPFCTDEYWKLKDKMNFIHHPYINAKIWPKDNEKSDGNSKVSIGIIGACANPKAKRIIAKINRMGLKEDYEFLVASRFAKQFVHMDHVKVIDLDFERKSMEAQIQKMDCLLLPYGKNEYKISASGVLWDAVSNQVPCFMLDSPYFCYYEKYICGFTAKSEKELIECMIRFIENPDKKIFGNCNMDEMNSYNKCKMKSLLQ